MTKGQKEEFIGILAGGVLGGVLGGASGAVFGGVVGAVFGGVVGAVFGGVLGGASGGVLGGASGGVLGAVAIGIGMITAHPAPIQNQTYITFDSPTEISALIQKLPKADQVIIEKFGDQEGKMKILIPVSQNHEDLKKILKTFTGFEVVELPIPKTKGKE